ncbi:hypothetical protein PRUPE_5G044500 [Prunus persica]|uniref:Transmembrane protein n=1 Tax=Prunus persica TaxID=3760 RepID=A0A251P3P7_PRUPE|nr:hypothetical protein PRUPE_5G044500 [Prunus persica]
MSPTIIAILLVFLTFLCSLIHTILQPIIEDHDFSFKIAPSLSDPTLLIFQEPQQHHVQQDPQSSSSTSTTQFGAAASRSLQFSCPNGSSPRGRNPRLVLILGRLRGLESMVRWPRLRARRLRRLTKWRRKRKRVKKRFFILSAQQKEGRSCYHFLYSQCSTKLLYYFSTVFNKPIGAGMQITGGKHLI